MSFAIRPATRQGVKPLIVLYSESGCGKTYSALLLARGLAGAGKIVMGDSESGRGSLYADIPEISGYETFDLAAPFSPARYVEAVDAIEQAGATIGIIDSGSHEWEGIGGVLDMAGEIEEKSGKAGLHCWKTPKFEHAKFVQRLLRTKIPFIVCLRAKYKSRQKKDDRGKTVIIKDEATSPIQAEDFIFEATCHAEILPNHSIVLTKCSHPSLRSCFPADKTEPIAIKHGQLLAKWCSSPGGSVAPSPSKPAVDTELARLKKELWALTKSKHGGTAQALNQWLWDEACQSDTETIEDMGAARLAEVLAAAKAKLRQPPYDH
jgi:hypothetical protein